MTSVANLSGVVGNDLDVERDIPGVSMSDPIAAAVITLKVSPTDTDANKVLQKRVTATAVLGVGQIAQDGSASNGDGTASVLFQLTKADTLTLGSAIRYYYDIRAFTAGGMSYNPELDPDTDPPRVVGSILLEDSVTDATV